VQKKPNLNTLPIMKTEAHFLPPSVNLFIKCLLLFFPVFCLIHVIISLIIYQTIMFEWQTLLQLLLFAVGISLIPTLASRQMKLVVTYLQKREPVQAWLMEYFNQRDWQMNKTSELLMEFQSKSKFYRLLQLDKTFISFQNHEVIIKGPYRIIDDVYSRLKFEQHDFE
jgi:hypothetical protein